MREQSSVATLNFASLVTRRQQVAPTKKSVVGGEGLKGVGSDFASACSCEHGEAKIVLHVWRLAERIRFVKRLQKISTLF